VGAPPGQHLCAHCQESSRTCQQSKPHAPVNVAAAAKSRHLENSFQAKQELHLHSDLHSSCSLAYTLREGGSESALRAMQSSDVRPSFARHSQGGWFGSWTSYDRVRAAHGRTMQWHICPERLGASQVKQPHAGAEHQGASLGRKPCTIVLSVC